VRVIESLREAQERELLRRDFDAQAVAASLLAAMDGLQPRYILAPHVMRIDEAFAQLAGQVLADLVVDSPRAHAAVAAWRAEHGRR
jgi:hypothetical protein